MQKSFEGRVWKLGNDIDTDIIMATEFLAYPTLAMMTEHLFQPLRPELAAQLRPGDIIVAGSNFGCGSSREMAASVLKEAGVTCIVAKSFARIFYRNAINNGFLLLQNEELPDIIEEGDTIEVVVGEFIKHKGVSYPIPPFSDEIGEILRLGGLVERMRALDKSKIGPVGKPKTGKPVHQPGYTLAQQILMNSLGRPVTPGEIVTIDVDHAVMHDIYMPYIFNQFREMGFTKVYDEAKVVAMVDHLYPNMNDEDPRCIRYSKRFQDEYGVQNVHIGNGISHQIALETGIAYPGKIVFGTDSHTTSYGAVGAFASGVGYSEMASIVGTGTIWVKVPSSIKIIVDGVLPQGVYAKDIILRVLGDLTASGALYKALEFTGSTIDSLSIASRVTIANMGVECGAKAALFAPDAKTQEFCGYAPGEFDWLHFDADAHYERTLYYKAEELVPVASCPYAVDNVHPVSEIQGLAVDQVFIGSCTNGRLEDLAIAASVLEGKHIAPNVKLIVTPASKEIYKEAMRLGYVKTFIEAGAMLTHPYCSLCQGRGGGVVSAGEVVLGTHNRNFIGRMGSPQARTHLVSPATAAASALRGVVTDPRELIFP